MCREGNTKETWMDVRLWYESGLEFKLPTTDASNDIEKPELGGSCVGQNYNLTYRMLRNSEWLWDQSITRITSH